MCCRCERDYREVEICRGVQNGHDPESCKEVEVGRGKERSLGQETGQEAGIAKMSDLHRVQSVG